MDIIIWEIFIVSITLVKTMHFQCKALASTNVLKVRIADEKWKSDNIGERILLAIGYGAWSTGKVS